MILPEVTSGLELIKRFRESKPEVNALVFSGYGLDPARQSAQWPANVAFLCKPFHLSELNAAIRGCLERSSAFEESEA
jgi:DNA-binding NtrC family response regulator